MKTPADTLSIDTRPADGFHASPGERNVRRIVVIGGLAGAVLTIVLLGGNARLHAPNLSLLALQPLSLQIHIAAAITAFLLGFVMMVRPKGDPMHKALGWIWVIAMVTTALSSFTFPWVLRGHFSVIHLLSGWVAVTVPAAVAYVKRGNIGAHRRTMTYNFLGGLIIAGAFTFVPGRLMWRIFFG